jgi:hypothetical protein
MIIPGRVQNGVVVFEGGSTLPDGAAVTITYPVHCESGGASQKQRIQVPLVKTGQPGSVSLTSEIIAAILDSEDASPRR